MKRENLLGKRYGRLVVVALDDVAARKPSWLCVCDCGNVVSVQAGNLTRNNGTRSCKCLYLELVRTRSITHGMRRTRIYTTWTNIRQRCLNKKSDDYKNYGGRGIKICERWNNFINFYEDMGNAPNGLTIERTDNNGNYSPENCKWATRKEQNNNKRNVRRVKL